MKQQMPQKAAKTPSGKRINKVWIVAGLVFGIAIISIALYTNKRSITNENDIAMSKDMAKEILVNTSLSNQTNYQFEPQESTITGVMVITCYFGPPGYGENPETDSKEYPYILLIEKPVNIISETGEDDVRSISEIQLTSTTGVKLNDYKGKLIRVTGTFFGAQTGHHHTDVLMDVKKIE